MNTSDTRPLIESIRAYNPGVTETFLRQFTAEELREYLRNLQTAQSKQIYMTRGPGTLRKAG